MTSTTNSNYSAAASNYATSSAPLPSPAASQQPTSYFSVRRHNSSTSIPQTQAQAPTSQPQPQSQQQLPHSQQAQGQSQAGYDAYSTSKENDFCVIAEAAKRAQMDVLMRDMGDVGL